MFACWMRVLAQVPGSVLWTSIEWPQAKARLQAFAAGQGIDPERLEFAPVIAPQAHLARLPAADLFPDCFPYSAGATAGQCVGQGVPLIAPDRRDLCLAYRHRSSARGRLRRTRSQFDRGLRAPRGATGSIGRGADRMAGPGAQQRWRGEDVPACRDGDGGGDRLCFAVARFLQFSPA